jgi:hypothetical protein
MGEATLNPTRHRINTFCTGYEGVSQQYSKPVPFPVRFDQNALHGHIRDVFAQAATILKSASVNSVAIPDDVDSAVPQVAELKGAVEELYAELDRRTRGFDTSIAIARQIFAEKLDEIEDEYPRRLAALYARNADKEAVLESALKAIQQSFEERLQQETAVHVAERNEIQSKLSRLQAEFALTQSTLSSSLGAARAQQELLDKQRAMLDETRRNVTAQIADKFSQELEALQSQCAIRTETLERENERLSAEIESSEEHCRSDIEKLRAELASVQEAQKANFDSMANKQLLQFEKRKRRLEANHQHAVTDIRNKIELEEMAADNEAQILRNEIEQHRKQLADAEERYGNALRALEQQAQVSIQQKDNEMRLLTRLHAKSMKQLEQRHRLDLERENHTAEKARHATEQKLQQTRREGEAQRKRLEGEIMALDRATTKYENQMQTKIAQQASVELTSRRRGGPTLSHARSDVADYAPTTLGKTPEVQAEIDGRLVKFGEAGKMELAALAKAVESVEQQFRAEEERMNLKLKEIHREREFLLAEKQRNLAKIKEMQTALDALQAPKPREAETVEAELNAKIAAQHAVIAEMNRELQERKADQTKKVELAVIWQEHEAELAQIRSELERMEAENAARVEKMKETYQAAMKTEKDRADKAVGALRQRYEQVMEEIRTTRDGFKDQELLDHQKWVATRKEMADSNNRILGTLQPKEPSRPTSSVGSSVSHTRSRPLPVLKR